MAKNPRTLTHEQVAALAESVGLPGETFAQIAQGESGYQVGATGHDPGGTTGLGLWQITTKYNDDIIKRYGGMQRLLTDPVANARAAKAIYDRQGIKAWYGTRYMTGPNLHYKGDTSAWKGAPAPPAGSVTPAAASPSGSSAPAAPELGDPGQSPDFTGLLGSLLSKSQPAQQQAQVQAPQFSAAPSLPQGFKAPTPEAVQAPEQQEGVTGRLSLLEGLRGVDPTQGSAPTTEGANGSNPEAPAPIAETVGQVRSGAGPTAALGWAKSYLGFKESGENEGGIASYANKQFGFSKAPWCAMFTSLAITKGGVPLAARTASVGEVRRKALAGGQGYQKGLVAPGAAKAGDLILFGDDHIGMVDHVENGRVHYVGGNQSDGVTMASVPVGRGDIVRPLYGARGKRR